MKFETTCFQKTNRIRRGALDNILTFRFGYIGHFTIISKITDIETDEYDGFFLRRPVLMLFCPQKHTLRE